MKRNDAVYLRDIIESIEIIFKYIENISEFELSQSLLIQDAIIRRFEIIGEATTKVSKEIKLMCPEIEWKLIKNMRNKLIHEYFGVSISTIYHTIITDLPPLKKKLLIVVSNLSHK